ncbi:MAG TPA: hypothetical protein IAA36_02150 [Candidatus Eubacterium pullicola]|nr:hypothetical protein [Candidatus Eubacterium pullicola]
MMTAERTILASKQASKQARRNSVLFSCQAENCTKTEGVFRPFSYGWDASFFVSGGLKIFLTTYSLLGQSETKGGVLWQKKKEYRRGVLPSWKPALMFSAKTGWKILV